MRLQNQYNVDMWKMQADYNSPQSQMQRFAEAGLNPNLIYGQGSNGNMSSAPEQGVPQAPDFSHSMQKMAEAFNLENLRTIIARRKEAQASAKNASLDAKRNEDLYDAELALSSDYAFDSKTGTFRFIGSNGNSNTRKVPAGAGSFFLNNILAQNYGRNYLIPTRQTLMNSQVGYLSPQIKMLNFDAKWQPVTYAIGQGTKVLGSFPLPKLNWSFSRQTKTFNKNY